MNIEHKKKLYAYFSYLHKAVALGLAGGAVHDDFDVLHVPVGAERLRQAVLVHGERQMRDIQLRVFVLPARGGARARPADRGARTQPCSHTHHMGFRV